MMSFSSLVSLLLLAAVAAVQAASTGGSRLLAIFDSVGDKDAYSTFFGDLADRGYAITYKTPKSDDLNLFRLGERAYDHVVVFPTKAKGLGPNLTPQLLVQFLNAKGNIVVALSSSRAASTSVVSLLSELDIALPAERTGLVVDHFAYDTKTAADAHDVVLLPVPAPRPGRASIFGTEPATTEVIAFPHGVGHVLGDSPFLTPVLDAPRTAYLYNPKEQPDTILSASDGADSDLFAAGAQLKLVSALQARNSARFALVGSAEMLSDAWFAAKVKPATGNTKETTVYNREFARRLTGWAFQETGVLRVNWIEHYLNEEGATNETNPSIYRVKNDVTYTISLSEFAWEKWTPFVVPAGDALQLEFSMLSPFQRLPLEAVPSQSTTDAAVYSVTFKLPDQHGIFNFMLSYKRPFLTYLEEKVTVSVRHMAHDEWPRSFVISSAWPWITGIGVTIVGWLAFCAVWIYSAPVSQATVTKKTQ